MKLRPALCCLILFSSACTLTPQDNGVHAEFHPPILYENWKIRQYALQSGGKACAVSSGYNAITVTLAQKPEGVVTYVESNRMMQPGSELTVSVGDTSFHSYEMLFTTPNAQKMVPYFLKGGKAYLEWSEIGGQSSRERIQIQNIVPLDNFALLWNQCRISLGVK